MCYLAKFHLVDVLYQREDFSTEAPNAKNSNVFHFILFLQ